MLVFFVTAIKGRGFHFEDTHVTDRDRIRKIFALLAIAFCWAHKTGEWQQEIKPIKIKKHGRPAVSLFRKGLDYIVNAIINLVYRPDLFDKCLLCLPSGLSFRQKKVKW